jgi:hypothetical protein
MKIPKPNLMEPSMEIYFDSFLGFGMQTNKLFSCKVLVMHELTKEESRNPNPISTAWMLWLC